MEFQSFIYWKLHSFSEYVLMFPCFLAAASPVCGKAVVGHASVVRGSVPRQCEERSHHVGPFGHRDPEGDRHQ